MKSLQTYTKIFLFFIILLLNSCLSSVRNNTTIPVGGAPENFEWDEFRAKKVYVNGEIPLLIIYPNIQNKKSPCILLLHGMASCKENWLTFDNFTKGGNLTKLLLKNGYIVAVFDFPMHGERKTKEYKDFESYKKNIILNWGFFYKKSYMDIKSCYDYIISIDEIDKDKIGLLGYSMGGMFVTVFSSIKDIDIKASIDCVSPVMRKYNINGSPWKYADKITDVPFLMIMANNDENYSVEDAKWLFNKVKVKDKNIIFMDSGHSLPVEYTKYVIEWFNSYLK